VSVALYHAGLPSRGVRRVYRHVPNLITISRLVLTVVFFAVLNVHQSAVFPRMMWVAFVIFVVATLTDVLDGYLARTWHVESAFGRVVDPFVDKILVVGAFVFFSSTDFINRDLVLAGGRDMSMTGVAPWMAVLLIAREFLITGIRGLAEARGIDFRSDWAGKFKMFVQSVAIGAVLVDLATAFEFGTHATYAPIGWVRNTRDILIWTTLVVTVLSATGYLYRARALLFDNVSG
jgi:CDP-diacylglycerol--glycerol-3-phosphate 3-phosphatidyltransferase